jgi:hypothetical protein
MNLLSMYFRAGRAHLEEGSTGVVDGFDQIGIGDADGIRTQPNNVTMLLMEFPLRFNMGLAIVIEEAPKVGELG